MSRRKVKNCKTFHCWANLFHSPPTHIHKDIWNRFRRSSCSIIIIIIFYWCRSTWWGEGNFLYKIKFPRNFVKTFVIKTDAKKLFPSRHRSWNLFSQVCSNLSLKNVSFFLFLSLSRLLELESFPIFDKVSPTHTRATMDYLKSFWWKQPSKDEPNHVEFSTVTTSLPAAANSSNNPAFLSIIHEVKTTTASSETLPSPNESFHTVKSSFNQPETASSSMGVSNSAYTGSHQDMTTPKSGTFTRHQHPPTQQLSILWFSFRAWKEREKLLYASLK